MPWAVLRSARRLRFLAETPSGGTLQPWLCPGFHGLRSLPLRAWLAILVALLPLKQDRRGRRLAVAIGKLLGRLFGGDAGSDEQCSLRALAERYAVDVVTQRRINAASLRRHQISTALCILTAIMTTADLLVSRI